MANKKIESIVNEMSVFDKLRIYFEYRSVQKALFFFSETITITDKNIHFHQNIEYPILRATESRYVKTDSTMTFDQFISEENIKKIEYSQTGQQTVYSGIYEWIGKKNI